jgi:hypothetical protein
VTAAAGQPGGAADRPPLCTYFDRNYLPQGIALYRSLERHAPGFRMTMLCMDDSSLAIARKLELPAADVISAEDLIEFEPRLAQARRDRGTVEFYYACTPWLVARTIETASAPGATYLDADMFFFADISTIYEEAPQASSMLIAHASGDERAEVAHGRFNVCLVHFRSSSEGRAALRWWGESTLKSTRLGDGVWGDQKYLDEFPERFPATRVIASPGAAPAAWNIVGPRLERREGRLFIGGHPLISYHFARFLAISRHLFVPIRREWLPRRVLRLIYWPYMTAIRSAIEEITAVEPSYRVGYTRRNLRGALLGVLAGRTFYEGSRGMRRLGVYVPSGRPEAMALYQRVRRRRTASAFRS